MQSFLDLFISINCSTCFRPFLCPSSGAQKSTYSVRYCQTMSFYLIHDSSRQQYWFDNTWRCMYSFVLLMMGGRTAWNMYLFIQTYFHTSHSGTYHENGKSHIHYTSSGSYNLIQLIAGWKEYIKTTVTTCII